MEDVQYWLIAFAAMVAISFVRQKANPMLEATLGELPGTLREELDRLLPDFAAEDIRRRKDGTKVLLNGDYRGQSARVEAEFDRSGKLTELEFDTRGVGQKGRADHADATLPAAAAAEVDRVLGEHAARFENRRIRPFTIGGELAFDVDTRLDDIEWEIEVTAAGRLLEFEREHRRR